MPGIASFVYNTLGRAYDSLGDFSKAIERLSSTTCSREGRAYGNLGNAYRSQGDYAIGVPR